jgi:hypothetical protein
MEAGGLFEPTKYEVKEGAPLPLHLYDNGVSKRTKAASLDAKFELATSGVVRNSALETLSFQQRQGNFGCSALRIRVENFIGIVKQRFRILRTVIHMDDIGMMDKIVWLCFMLHNFNGPIIK